MLPMYKKGKNSFYESFINTIESHYSPQIHLLYEITYIHMIFTLNKDQFVNLIICGVEFI